MRLSVFRSGQHIYGQVIDDKEGKTLAAASSNTMKTLSSPAAASFKNENVFIFRSALTSRHLYVKQ